MISRLLLAKNNFKFERQKVVKKKRKYYSLDNKLWARLLLAVG